MDDADMSRVLRAFAKNFRHVSGWRVPGGDVVLVGSNATHYPSEEAVARLAEIAVPEAKGRFEAALTDDAPRPATFENAHVDDLPLVEFHNARNLVLGSARDRERQ